MTRPAVLDPAVVDAWLAGHSGWHREDNHLVRELATLDYPSAVRLVDAQVDLAEALDHHALITLGYRHVRFSLWTHDQGGLTQLDLDYAQAFDDLVAGEFANLITG
ncbi:MAG: 4a-hydroxytetrahydrobiopterin dehydratase [Acidimicrobiales bacterium]